MTVHFGVSSNRLRVAGVAVEMEPLLPHVSSMHILIQVAMRWTRETLSEEGRRQLMEVLRNGIARFGKGSLTENDEAMLPIYRMLVRHSRSLVSRGLLYSRLFEENCYRQSAAFYRDWMEAMVSEGSTRHDVEAILELAKRHNATPARMLDETMLNLDKDNFDLRERVLSVLGDVHHDLDSIVATTSEQSHLEAFTEDDLRFVLSTTKMSEVLVYFGVAIALPSRLGLVSERIGAIRVLASEVDAKEPK